MFARDDSLAAHIFGQTRQRGIDAVLHEHLRFIEIGAELERNRDLHAAIARARRGHVKHALDAVDFLFERSGDSFGKRHCIGARILRGDNDRGRRDFRILRHGQRQIRERADERDGDAQDGGENRPVNEESRNVHDLGESAATLAIMFVDIGTTCGCTGTPGRALIKPETITRSFALSPSRMTRRPSMIGPILIGR